MVFHPRRDVIDLSIDDQPEVSGARMLPDLVPGVGIIHRCGPPSGFQHHDVAVCGVDSRSRCASAADLAVFEQDTMFGNAPCIYPGCHVPNAVSVTPIRPSNGRWHTIAMG